MRTLLISLWLAGSGAAQTRMREPTPHGAATDLRIQRDSRLLQTQPGNNTFAAALALDYIQKMRETVNFDYVEKAEELVNGILERDPGNYRALRLREEIAMERHEFAKVAEYSLVMTKFAPNDPGAWGSLGDASMELGEYERAKDAYERMVLLRPDLTSYNRLAWHRFVTGDAAGAIQLMQSAVAAAGSPNENLAWCLAELGAMYWKTGQGEPAMAAYRRALEVFPGYYAAWAGLGRIEAARDHLEAARGAYLKAQAAVPMPEYAAALERIYRRLGDEKRARQQRELVDAIEVTMQAAGEKTNRNVALLFADQKRNLERARTLVENELRVRPDVYTHDAMSWVLLQCGKPREAAAESREALRWNTPEPAFHYHYGMAEDALGHAEAARREFAAALALNPQWDREQADAARRKSGNDSGGLLLVR